MTCPWKRNRFHLGPGGITCTCCTPGHPRRWKALERRTIRRKLKAKLANMEDA